jgi:hypothetical protein
MLRIFGTLLAASLLSHEQTLAQTLTTLYAFTGGSDGSGPSAVSIGRDYVLYGTTSDADSPDAGRSSRSLRRLLLRVRGARPSSIAGKDVTTQAIQAW